MSAQLPNLSEYQDGPDRYVRFAEEQLDATLTREQRQLLRSLAENKRTIIMSGNGPGKSYGVALAKVSFLWVHHGSTILGTSGSYSQYIDAVWRSCKRLHKEFGIKLPFDVPEPNDSGQPSLELGDDWFIKVVSPRDPGDLEGRHGEHVMVVIEEADKKFITDEHFDSARSSVTSGTDRMLAVCNPPKDAANPVYDRLRSDGWNTIQFSTLHSHNVRVDADEIDGPLIPGITELPTVAEDYEEFNDEYWPEAPETWDRLTDDDAEYPGIDPITDRVAKGDLPREFAINLLTPGLDTVRRESDPSAAEFREDFDSRWYRRRAGVMPPTGSSAHRPIEPADVEAAWERDHPSGSVGPSRLGTGIDAARSGADSTIGATAAGDAIDIVYANGGDDYTIQRDELEPILSDYPPHPVAVDAMGEGSGLADMLHEIFPDVVRFGAGKEPPTTEAYKTYKSCWAEGLDRLGDALAEGASINDRKLFRELMVAARMVEFEERHLKKRKTEVYQTTESKEDIKEEIGRSPDRLDAAYMAVWARESGAESSGGFSHVGSMADLF